MEPIYKSKTLTAADDDGISLSQTPSGAGNLTITGAFASGGVATLDTGRRVILTFAADETGHTFVVYGAVEGGALIQETLAGTTAGIVPTTQNFKTVTRVSISAAATGAIKVGTNGVGSTPWQIVNWHIAPMHFGMVGLVTGTVNYTFQYTMEDPSGTFPNPDGSFPTAFDISDLASKSADTAASWLTPIAAWRLTVNSGTGTAQAVVLQAGIAGN
jgi:hypothetical protein